MKKSPIGRKVKITKAIREAWEQRDKSLDNGEVPQLPPEMWAKGTIGKYYRPIKTQVSLRIDKDVLDWFKAKGEGYSGRINDILRKEMYREGRA